MALSGHSERHDQHPLSGAKRISQFDRAACRLKSRCAEEASRVGCLFLAPSCRAEPQRRVGYWDKADTEIYAPSPQYLTSRIIRNDATFRTSRRTCTICASSLVLVA